MGTDEARVADDTRVFNKVLDDTRADLLASADRPMTRDLVRRLVGNFYRNLMRHHGLGLQGAPLTLTWLVTDTVEEVRVDAIDDRDHVRRALQGLQVAVRSLYELYDCDSRTEAYLEAQRSLGRSSLEEVRGLLQALEPRTAVPGSRPEDPDPLAGCGEVSTRAPGVGLAVTATEGPAPLSELRQDSAPMLQLRRDVKWLEDRGVRGAVVLSAFTLADMVGLTQREFEALSVRTRQRFENRAYTALRALDGRAR